MNFDDIKSLLDAFDPASLLPEVDAVLSTVSGAMRIVVLIAPVLLFVLGVLYIFAAPKEANHYFGYRCFFGMGSVEAWRYTQRIAGLIWALLGLGLSITMYVLTKDFPAGDTVAVLSSSLKYILCEAGLIIAACLAINTIVATQFRADGELRRRRR